MKTSRVLLGSCLLGLFAACGHKQLPPGTPPPEYHVPVLPPWSPADAGADAAPSTAEAPSEAEGGSVIGAVPDDAGAQPAVLDGGAPDSGSDAAIRPEPAW